MKSHAASAAVSIQPSHHPLPIKSIPESVTAARNDTFIINADCCRQRACNAQKNTATVRNA